MAAAGDSDPVVITDGDPGALGAIAAAWTSGRPIHVRGDGPGVPRPAMVPAGTATVVTTSGTAAAPRLVAHGRGAVVASCGAVSAALAVEPHADRWLACLPLRHVAGLAIVLRGLVTGTPVTVHERFDVERVARAAGECTLVSLVPTQLARLLDAGAPLERFRCVLLGGGPVPDGLVARAAAAGASVHITYGLTETFGGCVHDGRPLEGVEVRVDDGSGEILVRGPMLMDGYLDDGVDADTCDQDGWLRTGDVGRWRDDGRLEVVDRLSDIVVTGGVNVSPGAVEAVLAQHPDVEDLCVVGAPDAEWGERVVACVVARPGAPMPTLGELRALARPDLPAAALPREVRPVAHIPRTAGGKPLRRLLRA